MAVNVAVGDQERNRGVGGFSVPTTFAIEANNCDFRLSACPNPAQAGALRTNRAARDFIKAVICFSVVASEGFVVRMCSVSCIGNRIQAGIVRLIGSVRIPNPESYFERRPPYRRLSLQ